MLPEFNPPSFEHSNNQYEWEVPSRLIRDTLWTTFFLETTGIIIGSDIAEIGGIIVLMAGVTMMSIDMVVDEHKQRKARKAVRGRDQELL